MDDERRSEFAAIADRAGLLVVEDDVYGPLQDRPTLTAQRRTNSVVITSLSKTVAPGLRFGAIVGDSRLVAAVNEDMQLTSWMLAPAMVHLTTRWLGDGTAARRTQWQRRETEARWRIADNALGPSMMAPAPHRWCSFAGPQKKQDATKLFEPVSVRVAGPEHVSATPSRSPSESTRQRPVQVRISLSAARSRSELDVALRRIVEFEQRGWST